MIYKPIPVPGVTGTGMIPGPEMVIGICTRYTRICVPGRFTVPMSNTTCKVSCKVKITNEKRPDINIYISCLILKHCSKRVVLSPIPMTPSLLRNFSYAWSSSQETLDLASHKHTPQNYVISKTV